MKFRILIILFVLLARITAAQNDSLDYYIFPGIVISNGDYSSIGRKALAREDLHLFKLKLNSLHIGPAFTVPLIKPFSGEKFIPAIRVGHLFSLRKQYTAVDLKTGKTQKRNIRFTETFGQIIGNYFTEYIWYRVEVGYHYRQTISGDIKVPTGSLGYGAGLGINIAALFPKDYHPEGYRLYGLFSLYKIKGIKGLYYSLTIPFPIGI